MPQTKQRGWPFGNSIRGRAPGGNEVAAVTTGTSQTPSASRAGSMKKPKPSLTTSTGMPAARARRTNCGNPASWGWAAASERSASGGAVMSPTSHSMIRREPARPASYSAALASHSSVTNSAMMASETSVRAIVPS